jgi:hypothetical protein
MSQTHVQPSTRSVHLRRYALENSAAAAEIALMSSTITSLWRAQPPAEARLCNEPGQTGRDSRHPTSAHPTRAPRLQWRDLARSTHVHRRDLCRVRTAWIGRIKRHYLRIQDMTISVLPTSSERCVCRVLLFSLCCPPAHLASLPVPSNGCYSYQDSTGAEAFGFRPSFASIYTHC